MKSVNNPLRIPFNPNDFAKPGNYSFDIEGFDFSQDEKRYLPDFIDLGNLELYVDVMNTGDMYTLDVVAAGDIHLRDSHNGETRVYTLDDDVEVIIAPSNDEENDIFPDEDGIYDLRGSVLALLFDAIPKNYSEVPLEKVEKDNYVIMSEEEYLASRQKNSSPFSALDDEDLPDQND